MMFKTLMLKTRITIAAVISVLLVAATLLVLSKQITNSVEERFQDVSITSKTALWKKVIDSELDRMASNTNSISRDRETLKALKVADIELLEDNAVTTYNMLSAENILTKLQIINLGGQVLFSAPDNFKGDTRKTLPAIALKQGKIVGGIERDDDGKLYVNFAFPVYVRGKAVGVALYMRDLQNAIEDFKLNDKSDIFIVGANGDNEYATDKGLLDQFDLKLPSLGSQSMDVHELGDKAFSIVIQPIPGVDGQALAHLVSAKDQTKSYIAQQTFVFFSYLSIIIVLVLSIIGLTWYLRKSFKPLNDAVKIMNRLAQGRFSNQIHAINRNDEIGQLLKAMYAMSNNLRQIVGEVHTSTATIDGTSQNLSISTTDMSHRVEEQATILEETSSGMEEMTTTVQQNADSAQKASQLALNARMDAEKGLDVVDNAVQAMNEITEAGNKVTEIIATIDGIAFQTNLLALNAAVEAARAGEHGGGFSVVANEVRVLSKRSAEAAKEIKILINDSVEKVKTGTELVSQSGQTLIDIVESIKNVTGLIAEISEASQEQSFGIAQVNDAVIQMDGMTQQNTALVHQTEEASNSMKDEAVRLSNLMEFFKFDEGSDDNAAQKSLAVNGSMRDEALKSGGLTGAIKLFTG